MFNIFHVHKATPKCNELHSKIPILHDAAENATYQSLSVEKKLGNTKCPVYSVFSKINKQHYAMKIFPFINDLPSESFNNEARFTFMKHPNIIDFVHCETKRETINKGHTSKASYILMEYAQYGDFFDFILKYRDQIDEKLARTYFHQLIDGIEYLHGNGIAHVDLKPENLLLGDDFNLKIIDFDLSYMEGDQKVISRGTKYYRAPELFKDDATHIGSKRTFAADIYSAGIILFILKSGGIYPHAEDDELEGVNMSELMYKDNSSFWEKHCEIERKESCFYDRNFRHLFNHMVKEKPSQRMSIKQIKKSKWYNGPVYSSGELAERMKQLMGLCKRVIEVTKGIILGKISFLGYY